MIYPTIRAILLAGFGVPLALLVASLNPALWVMGIYWIIVVTFVSIVDSLIGSPIRKAELQKPTYPYPAVAREDHIELWCRFEGNTYPRNISAALECDSRLGLQNSSCVGRIDGPIVNFRFDYRPSRRGTAAFQSLVVRWQGPLGLVWKQKRFGLAHVSEITTNVRLVLDEAVRWFARNAPFGSKVDRSTGQGSEFHALRDFQTGMDRRSVDWKQSARHNKLIAKEFRTERNHNIIFALDAGRTMCEPIGDAPRIDRAINATLFTALACLRAGDRAGIYAFDEKPRASTGAISGASAFPTLQRCVANIDYSTQETNYVLGLATLSGELKRRSLIVVFTEFADQTAAQLMLESLGRVMKRHLVLFVAFQDEELEGLQSAYPDTPEDVARAVVASTILRERELVLNRLRRLGAHVVEGHANQIGPEILSAYLELKGKELL